MGTSEKAEELKKKIGKWKTIKPNVKIITSPEMIEFMLHLSITSPEMIEFMLHLSIKEEEEEEKRRITSPVSIEEEVVGKKRKRAEGEEKKEVEEIGYFEYFKDRVEDADNILSVVISNFIPDGKNKKYTKEKKSKKKSKLFSSLSFLLNISRKSLYCLFNS